VVKKLKQRNINARHSFKPMTMQPLFKQKINKNSLFYSKNVFYLHIDINKTLLDLQEECIVLKEVMEECQQGDKK